MRTLQRWTVLGRSFAGKTVDHTVNVHWIWAELTSGVVENDVP
jgi:hypothetical protein